MFKLEFETDNAALVDDDGQVDAEAVADVIAEADLEVMVRLGATRGRVFDANGNTIGRWELSQ
ncbi:hypothetical protein [Brevibacterium sp. CFH 10365]|uniref:hypothetical protein n=1 Tax=Brevibacterium sp. CFH 10365 TaxID=2585207 RepID=UPI001266396D|nr:hypothetical protein [Brevibacterium sp. CFH 10365]